MIYVRLKIILFTYTYQIIPCPPTLFILLNSEYSTNAALSDVLLLSLCTYYFIFTIIYSILFFITHV